MSSYVHALFRGALQHLWPTAGGQLTSAEMYVYFQDAGIAVASGALQSAWVSLRDRGLITGLALRSGEFTVTSVDPSLLTSDQP